MTMKLTTRAKGNVIIVEASGKLTLGEGTAALRNKLQEVVDGGSRRILLNMAGVTYIDSSGLGELVAAHMTATAAGSEIKLLNLANRVHDLLKLAKLYTVFETFEDEAAALSSFSAAKLTGLQAQA